MFACGCLCCMSACILCHICNTTYISLPFNLWFSLYFFFSLCEGVCLYMDGKIVYIRTHRYSSSCFLIRFLWLDLFQLLSLFKKNVSSKYLLCFLLNVFDWYTCKFDMATSLPLLLILLLTCGNITNVIYLSYMLFVCTIRVCPDSHIIHRSGRQLKLTGTRRHSAILIYKRQNT